MFLQEKKASARAEETILDLHRELEEKQSARRPSLSTDPDRLRNQMEILKVSLAWHM